MDVREKLIEICFREFCDLAGDSPCGCDGCPYGKYSSENGECYEEYKKDKFVKIEKTGVTVQEWISVDDRLPEEKGRYLTANKRFGDKTVVFDLWFGGGFWYVDEEDNVFDFEVTHWMPMPNPPKGE